MSIHSRCLSITICLLLCISCAPAPTPRVTVNAPVTGDTIRLAAVPDDVPRYSPISGIPGEVTYTFNTAVYGQNGFTGPWENYLVLTRISDPAAGETRVLPGAYQLYLEQDRVARHPRFSPDGTWIAFKVGQSDPANETYTLYLLNVATHEIIEGADGEGDQPLLWSPDNRYVVFYSGGYVAHERTWPIELYVFDRKTGKSVTVIESYHLWGVSWTANNHLLFGIAPEPWGRRSKAPRLAPGVYSYTPGTNNKPVRVIPDAIDPALSPDERWIAAFRTRATREGAEWPYERTLALYPRTGGRPVLLPVRDHGEGDTNYFWSSDSRQIYYAVTRTDDDTGRSKVSLHQYTLATRKTRFITIINNVKILLGPSRNGRYFFYSEVREPKDPKTETISSTTYLQALDLTSGKATIFVQARNWWSDFDWREK